MLLAIKLVFIGHRQFFGRNEMEGGIEVAHGHNQRVYGTTVFQITNQIDVQVFQRSLRLVDRIEVKHTLGRMLVSSVARIDNGNVGNFRGILGCTFYIMAHHDDIGIVGNHRDGVFQRFTFRTTGNFGVGKSDNSCTKSVSSSLET